MPSAAAMARSSGVVMNPRTRSALAPTYTVVTVTVALSSLGYWRTFSERTACRPATRMTRLTTIASTGRRMKMSVNFMALAILRLGRQLRAGLDVVLHHHRRPIPQLETARDHNLLARGHAVRDGDVVAAGLGGAHELLARDPDRLAVGADD